MTAVVRLRKKNVIEVPDEGLINLLAPLRQDIINKAANAVAAEINNDFAGGANATPTAKDERTLASEESDVILMARKKKEMK